MMWNGNPIGVKRLNTQTLGRNHQLIIIIGVVMMIALEQHHHSATLATGATLYENALNDLY